MQELPIGWRCAEPGTLPDRAVSQCGSALIVVLGVLMILSLIVAGIAGQLRTQLRATRLDRDVASIHAILASALRYEAVKLQNQMDDIPSGSLDVLLTGADPASDCTPTEQGAGTGLRYCTMRYRGELGVYGADTLLPIGSNSSALWQIPVRVRWQLDAADVNHADGWIIVDQDLRAVLYIFQDHQWCRTKAGWNSSSTSVCEVGG